MRVIIVTEDNVILVDGVDHRVDCAPLKAAGLWALQWFDTFGEEEYRPDETGARAPNKRITDFSPYQPYVDLWQAAAAKANINPTLNSTPAKTAAQILGV